MHRAGHPEGGAWLFWAHSATGRIVYSPSVEGNCLGSVWFLLTRSRKSGNSGAVDLLFEAAAKMGALLVR